MLDAVNELKMDEEKYRKKADNCRDAVRAIQDACDHERTVPDGHDSHQDYVKCTRCGKRF